MDQHPATAFPVQIPPACHFIGNEQIPATDGRTIPVIDPSNGILGPYMEGNRSIAQCPNFTPERFALRFNIPVASYAYNDQFSSWDVVGETIVSGSGPPIVTAFV